MGMTPGAGPYQEVQRCMFISVRRNKIAKIIEDAKTVVSDRLIAEKTAFCDNLVHLGSNV